MCVYAFQREREKTHFRAVTLQIAAVGSDRIFIAVLFAAGCKMRFVWFNVDNARRHYKLWTSVPDFETCETECVLLNIVRVNILLEL